MSEQRIVNLYNLLDQGKYYCAIFTPGPTMTYLTGFHFNADERPKVLFLGKNIEPVLILPEFEMGLTEKANFPVKTFPFGENPELWSGVFKQACDHFGIAGKNIAIDPLYTRMLELRFLEAASPTTQFDAASVYLDGLRMQKDEHEIFSMRRAAHIAQQAFKATLPVIKVGVTEREVASELVFQLLKNGCDPHIPFSPIVASGPNSANPHAHPGERHFSPGDLVVVDWGASYQGYCADITRTLAIGGISPELEKIAQIVMEANKAGRNAAKTGVIGGQVDHAARTVIETAGYGKNFIHRTGHGLGIEVHEPPYIYADSKTVLTEGMTFTVEPGIYLAGYAGVRIEDNVVVREKGGESLTDLSRELIKIY